MSLRLEPLPPIPDVTAAAVRAAFPKGNIYVDLRAEFGTLYTCSGPTTRTHGLTNTAKTGPDSRAMCGTAGPHSRPTDPHSGATAHQQPIGPTLAANASTSWSING